MPTLSSLAVFLAVTAVYSLVPGPAVMLIVSRAMLQGTRAGLASVAGITTANLGFVVLAALGVAALMKAFPTLFHAIQLVGAAYIVWIAIQTIRHPVTAEQLRGAGPSPADGEIRGPSSWRTYFDAVAVQASNPKAILYLAAFLPQFVDPDGGPVSVQMGTLCAIGTFVDVFILSGYAWIGGRAVRWMTRPGAAKAFSWTAGVLLMVAALGVSGIFQR